MKFNNRDDIIQLTPLWEGERFDDGRPRVPDNILQAHGARDHRGSVGCAVARGLSVSVLRRLDRISSEKRLVGRAVTGVFVPHRPDLHDCLMDLGQNKEGRIGAMNSWVIETLVEDDVIVIDLFDKVYKGTYSGRELIDSHRLAHQARAGDLRRHP